MQFNPILAWTRDQFCENEIEKEMSWILVLKLKRMFLLIYNCIHVFAMNF